MTMNITDPDHPIYSDLRRYYDEPRAINLALVYVVMFLLLLGAR
jgi:hypothetical protein